MCNADTLLLSARNPYIDDRAQVQRAEEDDQCDDDEDSFEAQIRCTDEKDFNRRGILADHNARVLLTAPYCIPAQFLQSGAETPVRGKDWDPDTNIPSSRATSVMPTWLPPPPTGSWAPTPAYEPAEPTPLEGRRARTPLSLPDPDSRGHTPFQLRNAQNFMPYVSPRDAIATSSSAHPRPASSSPLPRAKRVCTASPPRNEARAQRLYKKLATYLDTTAADSSEEENPQDSDEEDNDELRDSDIARFDKRACDYAVSAAREKHGAVAYVAPDDPALGVVVNTLSTLMDVHPAPHNKSLRAMEHRLKPGLPAKNPPVVARLWILLNGGLAFVLGPKKVLMEHVKLPVPEPRRMDEEKEEYQWKAKPEDTPDRCEERQIAHVLYQKKYPAVQPTINQLLPFRTSCCKALQSRPFAGPSQPLEAGDYVLILDGERHGQTAYVLQIEKLSANGQFKHICQLTPHFPFHNAREKSFPYALSQILSPPRPSTSWIACGLPSLEAPFDEQLPSTLAVDGSQTIEVPIKTLNQYFLPRDHVVVVRGNRKNLHGLVIKVLEDVAMGPGWTVKRHKTGCFNLVDFQVYAEEQAQTLRVMRAHVDFVIFHAENTTSTIFQQYTRTAVVNEPRGATLRPHINSSQTIEYRGAAQADDVEAYLAQQASVAAATTKMVQLEPPATFAQLHSILQARDKAAASSTSLLKLGGVEHANKYVQVQGMFRHQDKGFRGQITASFDTKERSNRLRDSLPLVQAQYLPLRVLYTPCLMTPSSPKPRPRTPTPLPQESDPQGTTTSGPGTRTGIREQESLQQRLALKYNQQSLPAELDGTWLGTAGLVGKRVDVVIERITTFVPPRRIREISAKAIASEGLPGVVLLTEAVSNFGKQLTVFRVGPKQHKIVFPPSCVKPQQDHPQGDLITKRVDRVIVLVPDDVGDISLVGSYAQTQLEIMHPHSNDVVGVRHADGSGPFFPHPATLPFEERDGRGV
ncbi:hypothetical protein DFH09DRAFT_1085516 [Mycena vulgaris]|nr:hypothetical protein DFH09DRAFT_1085516 [Mycena vulgaris]